MGDHPSTWYEYAGKLTYTYNTQVHRTTGFPTFDLVLSRHSERPF